MSSMKFYGLATLLLFGFAVVGLPAPASMGSAVGIAVAQADDDDDDDGVRSKRWRDRGYWRDRAPRWRYYKRRYLDDDGRHRVYRGWRGRDDDDN